MLSLFLGWLCQGYICQCNHVFKVVLAQSRKKQVFFITAGDCDFVKMGIYLLKSHRQVKMPDPHHMNLKQNQSYSIPLSQVDKRSTMLSLFLGWLYQGDICQCNYIFKAVLTQVRKKSVFGATASDHDFVKMGIYLLKSHRQVKMPDPHHMCK